MLQARHTCHTHAAFFKGSGSTDFRLCGPHGLCHDPQLCYYSTKAAADNMQTYGLGCAPIKLYRNRWQPRFGQWNRVY